MRPLLTARRLHHRLGFLWLVLALPAFTFAQGAPLTLGPLTVTVPQDWPAQTNTVPVRLFSPDSTAQQNFSVEFFPPEQLSQDLAVHHGALWGRMANTFQITAPPRSGMLGPFVWTRSDTPRGFGRKETFILYSTQTAGIYVGVAVHGTNANLVARHMPVIEMMLRNAVLSGGAPGPASSMPGPAGSPAAAPAAGNPASLSDYVYTAPAGWTTNQYSDGIVLTSPMAGNGERCLISMWPMRSSSGNLQRDADVAFREIFNTYQLKSQTSAGFLLQSSITRGTSGQGWDYVLVKNGIAKPGGQYETLLGFVMVAGLNNRLAVISGLSKDPMVSTCMGELTGSTNWPRFFHSLSFKNWHMGDQSQAMRKRLAGVWTAATASASDQITFAGNGRYANASAAQQYYLSSTELLTTTQAYFGNGSYTLRGNAITLTQDDRKNQPDRGFFRVEEESKDGGQSWTPALYILRTSAVDGKEYELKYGKTR